MSTPETLLWSSFVMLAYIYVGYPAVIWAWAHYRPRTPQVSDIAPTVSIIIVAHNEARRIAARLQNVLALDYPKDRLQIILASDGSTDETVERAREYEAAGVTIVACPQRRGKPALLDELVPTAAGQIVVLADARQRFEPTALQALVRHFADPSVGAVSGELLLTKGDDTRTVGEGVGFYWRYEKLIRQSESRLHSSVGATGAIYALRRELFKPIPAKTILDDVLIPMNVVRQGYRVLFESKARAYDVLPATARAEFTRKVRTIGGNFQLFARERWLLNPLQNPLWFQTISHKAARLLAPVFHVTAFAANVALATHPGFAVLLAMQIAFYAIAWGGFALRNAQRSIPFISVPYAICLLSWATIVAFVRYVSGRQRVTWDHASA